MKALRTFLGELHESFFMAMTAVISHKLRSVLTLLGILVGVFSIIVVMTTMRAMQKKNSIGSEPVRRPHLCRANLAPGAV